MFKAKLLLVWFSLVQPRLYSLCFMSPAEVEKKKNKYAPNLKNSQYSLDVLKTLSSSAVLRTFHLWFLSSLCLWSGCCFVTAPWARGDPGRVGQAKVAAAKANERTALSLLEV